MSEPAAPSESSAGQRHLDGLKRSSSPLVVEAATEAEATLRAASASPEPRCDTTVADHDALIERLRLEAESCYPQMAGLLTEAADALAALSAPPTDPEARWAEQAEALSAAAIAAAYKGVSYQLEGTWGPDPFDDDEPTAPPGDETVERARARMLWTIQHAALEAKSSALGYGDGWVQADYILEVLGLAAPSDTP